MLNIVQLAERSLRHMVAGVPCPGVVPIVDIEVDVVASTLDAISIENCLVK